MKSTIAAAVRITGFDCDPTEITQALGITPSRTWLRGEKRIPKASIVHSDNGWELKSTLLASTLEDQITELLKKLLPVKTVILGFGPNYFMEFSCSLSLDGDERPEMNLSPQTVIAIASLGSALDIDLI